LKYLLNAEISLEIDAISREEVTGLRTIRNRTHYFAEDEHSPEEKPKTGRLGSIDQMDAIRAIG
jgi:hypothetical protein